MKAAEGRAGGGARVFRQQRVVCGWEVSATEAVPHLFNSGQPLPALLGAWTWAVGRRTELRLNYRVHKRQIYRHKTEKSNVSSR